MARRIANLATAASFLVLGLAFAWFGYLKWVWGPDCALTPAACQSFAAVHATWSQGAAIGFAVLCFGLAARVIWNMRRGDRS